MNRFQDIYRRYRRSVVMLSGLTASGDPSAATAFHIGDGIFVTARHVADELHNRLLHVSGGGVSPYHQVSFTEPDIDVALLLCDVGLLSPEYRQVFIPLPPALNDLIDESQALERVLVMGYPRIPMTANAHIVAATGEIISVVWTMSDQHGPSFVISHLPRGGLSGAPVFDGSGELIGVVVDSLGLAGVPYELGYTAATTVEPILRLLAGANLLPPGLTEEDWDLFTSAVFPMGIPEPIVVPAPPARAPDGEDPAIGKTADG
jgi:hypothetical protein